MKIFAINASSGYANKSNSKTAQVNQTFKGYVNGKFYKDEIIRKAKQALKEPKILKAFKQKSFLDTYKSWHEGNMASSKGERILLGILTIGLSEISYTLFARLNDIMDNEDKKKELDQILNCMQDLANEK